MPDETLFTAARRAVREFNIMMNHDGGLVSHEMEWAMSQLSNQVEQEMKKRKIPTEPLPQEPQ